MNRSHEQSRNLNSKVGKLNFTKLCKTGKALGTVHTSDNKSVIACSSFFKCDWALLGENDV